MALSEDLLDTYKQYGVIQNSLVKVGISLNPIDQLDSTQY